MRTRQKADPQNGRFPLGAIADVAVRTDLLPVGADIPSAPRGGSSERVSTGEEVGFQRSEVRFGHEKVTFPVVSPGVILRINKLYEFQNWKLACGSTQLYNVASDSAVREYSYSHWPARLWEIAKRGSHPRLTERHHNYSGVGQDLRKDGCRSKAAIADLQAIGTDGSDRTATPW